MTEAPLDPPPITMYVVGGSFSMLLYEPTVMAVTSRLNPHAGWELVAFPGFGNFVSSSAGVTTGSVVLGLHCVLYGKKGAKYIIELVD